jgi:hypothetical protein
VASLPRLLLTMTGGNKRLLHGNRILGWRSTRVEPAPRGSASPKELVDIVKALATERGFDGAFLDIPPKNARVSSLYSKEGLVFLDE